MRYWQCVTENKWFSLGWFLVVALLFAAYFGSLRFARGEWDQVPFEKVVAGQAMTPFQYRVLVPWAVGWAERHILPLPGIATGRKLAFLIEVGSIFGLLLVFRLYLKRLFGAPALASLLAMALILVLPFNYWISGMWMFWLWYDMPSLLFFAAGLLLLLDRRWKCYYPLFVLATLNRETTCFLTLVYLITALGRDRGAKIIGHVTAQAALWVTIKICLSQLFIHNPGAGASLNNLASNLAVLTTQPNLVLILLSSIGYLWLPACLYYPCIQNEFVRRALWITPLFFLVMLYSGNLPEVRIYGEMILIVLPAVLMILKQEVESAS